MSGVWYGLSMVGVALVIYWYIKNDAVPMDQRTSGIFAMKISSDMRIRNRTKRKPFSLKSGQ
ncbi:MAG TPA: hypothetical protein VG891_12915 [Rhizomicrobium sp.]|nr:hypothetical protein [Rhizomicrobium sp.]